METLISTLIGIARIEVYGGSTHSRNGWLVGLLKTCRRIAGRTSRNSS